MSAAPRDLPAGTGVQVFVALGANLGHASATLLQAFDRLEQLSAGPLRKSSLWESAPVDCPPGSPKFANAVVALVALNGETPDSLLKKLQSLEKEFGRRPKTVANESRPLDLDLIAWGNETRRTPALTLPHPRAHQRPFVLAPFAELSPQFVLPGQTRSVQELLRALPVDPSLRII